MSRCPYTWFRGLLGIRKEGSPVEGGPPTPASALRVRVRRNGEDRVNVELPARSARWLIELIPGDVLEKIRLEQIPIEAIQAELAASVELYTRPIFVLTEPERKVEVWLE
jgi:hypothetical protein